MAAVNFTLKNYQQESLDRLRDYLIATCHDGTMKAFSQLSALPYHDLTETMEHIIEDGDENFDIGTPYICLRIPTGGGKTIMGAHAVGIAAQHFLQVPNPMVLWLVPSDAILQQTLNTLRDQTHPYYAALSADFGDNFIVMDKAEALAMSRPDAEANAVIIVATIQSFRRKKPNGEDNDDGLKVYDDAGALMAHFSGLDQSTIDRLEKVTGTNRPIASLKNVLRLHRPMVIVDEAHNANTSLSYKTLARFSPSMILEFTATPQTEHDPKNDKYASNILHSVSAAELKAEEMIKLPIQLTTNPDWRNTITHAITSQNTLEQTANAEKEDTGEYIRPIILFQAQAASASDPDRLTYDKLETLLKEDHAIPAEQIVVQTGTRNDLDKVDLKAPDCPIRFIITVQKLKEGWDCPFAYILCSVAEQTSKTAVEQILGRILRLPLAKRKQRDALNQAYAFVASSSFETTAQSLTDRLVEGSGFNRLEAAEIITRSPELPLPNIPDGRVFISQPLTDQVLEHPQVVKIVSKLENASHGRATFSSIDQTISITRSMNKAFRNELLLITAPIAGAEISINRLYAESNGQKLTAPTEERPAFIVPQLGLMVDDVLKIFTKDHYFHIPWHLEKCDPSAITELFKIRDNSQLGLLDVTAQGRMQIQFVQNMQKTLDNVLYEAKITRSLLIRWLDKRIHHPEVQMANAVEFIDNAVKKLETEGHSFDILVQQKYSLKQALARLVDNLRNERGETNYKTLFETRADHFKTSADIGMIFDEANYSYNNPYDGAYKFNKHYTPIIGDLKSTGEEFECACHIDQMDEVLYWIRNVDRKPGSFWLQMPNDKFYPDFVARLKDGRTLVVEYKGEYLVSADDARQKDLIGNVWADCSDGACLFVMVTDQNFDLINQTIGLTT